MSRTGIIFYAPLHEDDRVCGILTGRYRQYQMRNIISSTYFGEPAATYLFLPDGTMIASSTEDAPENILDVFDDGFGGDVVLCVVGFLDGASPSSFVDCLAQGVGHFVGVQDDASLGVSGGAADGLNEGTP